MRDVIPAALLGLMLAAGPALAQDAPPELDVEKTCNSSGRAEVGNLSQKDSKDGCLRSERAAHDELKKRWGEFTPAAKKQCSKQAVAGGFPSYVETVTCLELASGGEPGKTGADKGSAGAGGAGAGQPKGSELTAEPSAKQRTNPIEVLDNKP